MFGYGWGYLYAHGLVTPQLIRDNLIAGAVAVALVLGFVLGLLEGQAEEAARQRLAAPDDAGTGRRAA